jgi:hypothetical protein
MRRVEHRIVVSGGRSHVGIRVVEPTVIYRDLEDSPVSLF